MIAAYVAKENLVVDWLLETHVHADHLTAANYLQQRVGGASVSAERSLGFKPCSPMFSIWTPP